MKKIVMCTVTLLMMICLSAQVLPQGQDVPVSDGIISVGEYPLIRVAGKTDIGIALSADKSILYLSFTAPTDGWVALGLGSLKMNGAFMVMAFDNKGKVSITEETGKGKMHSVNKTKVLLSQAVKEADGKTVLEFAVNSAEYIKNGKLDLIAAFGNRDSRTALHAWKTSLTVQIP